MAIARKTRTSTAASQAVLLRKPSPAAKIKNPEQENSLLMEVMLGSLRFWFFIHPPGVDSLKDPGLSLNQFALPATL
jgi:hypothetical protein